MAEPISFGRRFGQGVVLDPDAGRTDRGARLVRLLCHPHEGGCGTEYETLASRLRAGDSRSCGCLRREAFAAAGLVTTHGLARHTLYDTWKGMLARCEDPTNKRFADYGGRVPPITVYGPWHDVARFVADIEAEIGPRPGGLTAGGMPLWTLNRKDNDGPYDPGNVEWADWSRQCRNRRGIFTPTQIADQTQQAAGMRAAGRTWAETAAALGISVGTARRRLAS